MHLTLGDQCVTFAPEVHVPLRKFRLDTSEIFA